MMPRPAAWTLAALLGVLFTTAVAHAQAPTIYKWVDENGVAHYTTDRDRIPGEVRARIQRTSPAVAAPPQHEDEMRDAVRIAPKPNLAAPVAEPVLVPAVEPPAPKGQALGTEPAPPAPAATAAVPAPASQPAPAIEEPIPPPLSSELLPSEAALETDPVSAPPPAPLAPLTPKQGEEVVKIDTQIESLEGQIADREEKLAMLLSSTDEERAAPLIDDPKFREIAQVLPKLQAELQTLRERRNKIQPPATP